MTDKGGGKRSQDSSESELSGSETEAELRHNVGAKQTRRGKNAGTARGSELTRAKAQLKKAEEEAREDALDRALRSRAFRKDVTPVLDPIESDTGDAANPSDLSPEGLRALAEKNTAAILEVAKKSGHLQGPFVKRLRDSAAALKEVVDTLAARSEADETRRLRRDNTLLRREVESLKAELGAHRKEFEATRSATTRSTPPPQSIMDGTMLEELRSSIVSSVGGMISARFEDIEERLLPLPDQRRKQRQMAAPASDVEGPVRARPGPAPVKPARRPEAVATSKSTEQVQPAAQVQPMKEAVAVPPTQDGYSLVAKRGKKKTPAAAAATPKEVPKKAAVTAARSAAKTKPRLTPPSTAAVIITLQQGAASAGVTYSQVLAKAAVKVKLAEFGIESLNFRQSATGARVLELPKGHSVEKADQFAEKLRTTLEGMANVVRPTKCVEIRISNLDDSATRESVVAAVSLAGECASSLIRAREVRSGPGGMGAVVVQCPVAAAKKLVEAGRILVGWSSARVEALEQRPMRCFRCMGVGHTRPVCQSRVDRGSLCFQCGAEGHRAAVCTATPRCAVCADAGRPAGHHMGGVLCNPPRMKGSAVARSMSATDAVRPDLARKAGQEKAPLCASSAPAIEAV